MPTSRASSTRILFPASSAGQEKREEKARLKSKEGRKREQGEIRHQSELTGNAGGGRKGTLTTHRFFGKRIHLQAKP